jgi:UDP-N-acetylglucosamine transferase subunit ALG13
LSDFTEPILIQLGKGDEMKTFQLKILNLVRQETIRKIFDFVQKKTITRPHDTVRTIEILFKQQARNELVCVRNQFYDRNQVLDDLS